MLVAIDAKGEATTDALALGRARAALDVSAEMLAAVCQDRRASPEAVAEAFRRVSDAFAEYGRQMLSR